MLGNSLLCAAVALGSCVSLAGADIVVSSRDSTISVGLITVGPPVAPVSSTLIDSAADLALAGSATYTDGFGRDFFGAYDALQDVTFGANALSAHQTQSANSVLNSPGFPASNVFSIEVINRYESAFTVTEDTTMRLTLNFTGTVTLGSAADRVDFRINTDFGGMFVMPLAVPGGQYVNETLTFDFLFLAGTNYTLISENRAFSGGGEGVIASELSFNLAPVPAPSSVAMVLVGGCGWLGRRRR